ncbi:MAG TPA: transporter substrate-binding domain-containing protein [Bacteroidales bacterium]|nr:transporter substrate-binding domain-containing protein [Bacteroidales bacterium]
MKKVLIIPAFILIIFILFCREAVSRDLTTIKRSGRIYVGFTKDDLGTINYDLAVEFAKYLNVEMIPVNITWEECFMKNGVIPADLETNASVIYDPDIFKKADIICSTFTILEWRRKIFGFAQTLNSAELLITDQNKPAVKSFSDLAGKTIAFMKGTSFETHMIERDSDLNGAIKLMPVATNEEAKELLKQGKVYGIVLDADEALIFNADNNQRFGIALPITPMAKTAWVVEKGNTLRDEVEDFFRTVESNEVLDKIFFRKFGIRYSAYIETINKIILLEKHKHDLDKIIDEEKLVVGLRDKAFVYGKGENKQFMQLLAQEFADYLGISIEYLETPYTNRYWEKENGKINRDSAYSPDWFDYIDMAADAFAPCSWQNSKADFIPVVPSSNTVIAKRGIEIKSREDLKKLKGVVPSGSAFEEILKKENIKNYKAVPDTEVMQLLLRDAADYTIVNDFRFQHYSESGLEAKLDLGATNICWALRKDQPKLKAELIKFIALSKQTGFIRYLLEDPARSDAASARKYFEKFQPGQFPSYRYGAESGLPQEEIHSIFQDRQGYLWFGTCAGAVRYNGREMKSIGDPDESSGNIITSIAQDSEGLIYLASSSGVTVIRRDTISERLLPGRNIRSVLIDHSDNKWLTGSDSLYLVTKNGKLRSMNSEFHSLPAVRSVAENPETGVVYMATGEGIFCYPGSGGKLTKINGINCSSLLIDKNGNFWISTSDGMFLIRGKSIFDGDRSVVNLSGKIRQGSDAVKSIITDAGGSVWIVFDSRIVRMNSLNFESTVYDISNGLMANRILSALVDREDNLWIGYNGGLQRLACSRGLRNFFAPEINSYINSFTQADDGRLWITSNNGIFVCNSKPDVFKPGLLLSQNGLADAGEKFVLGKMAGGNLIFAGKSGLYELDPSGHRIIRSRLFDRKLEKLSGIYISSKNEIILLSGAAGAVYYMQDFDGPVKTIENELSGNITRLTEYNGRIFGGNGFGIVEVVNGDLKLAGRTGTKVWSLYIADSTIWIGTDHGLLEGTWDDFNDFEPVSLKENTVVKTIIPAVNRNYLWIGTNSGFAYFNTDTEKAEFFIDSKDGLSGDEITPGGLFIDRNNLLWVGTYHGADNYNLKIAAAARYQPSCFIEKILLNGRQIEMKQGQVFRYNQNNFIFEMAAISFTDENATEFEFYIRGTGNNYSSYNKGKESKAYYNNLPPGKYEFLYKAKGKNNIQSYSQKYVFEITPAWFNTWIFRISVFLLVVLLAYMLYRARVKTIEAQKKKLEALVKQRTHDLEVANVEIQAQRDMARSQRDRIAEQKKEITDSIHYAERIQRSLLPPVITLETLLPEHFVLFKPRNIVSGDFYWSFEKGDYIYVAAVDCTGHGVPGALMSMLGISFLNEIVIKSNDIDPAEIINNLRESVMRSLKQAGQEGESRDGMDLSILRFDKAGSAMSFAGANNPLYIVRNGSLEEIKGDKMPVGIYEKMIPFTLHAFEIKKGDTFYIFSDGYADQFGGPRAKKFMYSGLKKLLLEIQPRSMKEQGKILDETIIGWQGSLEQVDDIVVIGLRF